MGNAFLKFSFALFAIAALPTPATAQEAVGRLFFTPAQRASLDGARSQRARTTLGTDNQEEQAVPAAQTLRYGGMVRRSDGKSTVWINNRPVNDNEPARSAVVGRVHPDGSVSLQVPQSGRNVELKPGQSIELLSGAIEESYSRRQVQPETKMPAEAKSEKPKPAEAARTAERDREDEQRKLEEAVRYLQEAAKKAAAAPSAAAPAGPTR
jgi:hypothetical protein